MKPLCIHHHPCADGFGSAWVVWKYFKGEVDFHAGVYQTPPPDVKGREVIIVDFSYKRPVMEQILNDCASLLILDHHKSAIDDLKDLIPIEYREFVARTGLMMHGLVFDLNRSGAMITWDHFFPGQEPPQLLKHIQDRDLWQFKLEGTEDIQAALFSYPYDFKIWDKFMRSDFDDDCIPVPGDGIERLRLDGIALTRKHHKDIAELVKVTGRRMKIAGFDVPVANLPYTLSSDAGHLMGKGEPFAACYYDTPGGRCFSLRSAPDGQDVSEIAKKFGGGGHRAAAGFTMPLGWEGDK